MSVYSVVVSACSLRISSAWWSHDEDASFFKRAQVHLWLLVAGAPAAAAVHCSGNGTSLITGGPLLQVRAGASNDAGDPDGRPPGVWRVLLAPMVRSCRLGEHNSCDGVVRVWQSCQRYLCARLLPSHRWLQCIFSLVLWGCLLCTALPDSCADALCRSQRYGNGGKYFGDASCFVWNARHGRVTAFKHVGRQRDGSAAATVPQMMQGEVSHMAIARGDTGQHALQIDQNLRRGLSFHTDVLKNESLAGQNAEFLISQIEVWGFGPTVEEQEAPLPETPSGEHCRAEGATDNDSDPSMWL
eukprot:m.453592 g.453592  ORF g.453592 m.453592 type:complete len:300 (-) comp21551_c0_seq3:70-969(-)